MKPKPIEETKEDSIWTRSGFRPFGVEPVPVSPLRASIRGSGHRGYIDNPRLISVRVHKAPVPRGHRAFMGKQEWRR